jgi:hypothetical protein
VGRKVDIADLVGTPEIAERLDIEHHNTINTWRRRHPDFPEPVLRLRNVALWLWPEVEAWARRTGRLR